MPVKPYPAQAAFGLLPEPERNAGSFLLSIAINGLILALMLYLAATAKRSIDQHTFVETMLILPAKPPAPQPRVKIPPPPPLKQQPKIEPVKFEAPKIKIPKPEPKPALKPIQMEARLPAPSFRADRPSVILAPQPKLALAAAAMPAQVPQARPSTAPVHLGQTWGVMPNPNPAEMRVASLEILCGECNFHAASFVVRRLFRSGRAVCFEPWRRHGPGSPGAKSPRRVRACER